MPCEINKRLEDEAIVSSEFESVLSEFLSLLTLNETEDVIKENQVDFYLQEASIIPEALYAALFLVFTNSYKRESDHLYAQSRIRFRLNPNDPNMLAFLDNYRRSLITYFNDAQTKASNLALEISSLNRFSVREKARALVKSIGLTEKQLEMIASYRRSLEKGSVNALQRALRDKRSDKSIINAINLGSNLSEKQIDSLVERYRKRFIKYRADTIAQTEVLTMLNFSKNELYRQAIDSGKLAPGDVRRIWQTRDDKRVRNSHAPMNGQTRGFNEPFESGSGNSLMFPGDPAAPLNERAGCRCQLNVIIS